MMSRRLAAINTEVPIDIDFEEFKVEEPDCDALIDLYRKLEFNSFLKKLQVSQKIAGAGARTAAEGKSVKRTPERTRNEERPVMASPETIQAAATLKPEPGRN